MGVNIDKFLEPSEVAAATAVPLGGVIMWMNVAAAAPDPTAPVGFEFCDGTAVTTVGSPLLGETKPNLMVTSAGGTKGFTRGADVTGAPYGVGTAVITGGSDDHNHVVNSGGDHSHQMGSHTHNMQSHTHSVPSGGSHTHGNTGTANQSGVSGGSTYSGGVFAHNHSTSTGSSSHSHPNTGGPSNNTTQGPSTDSTNSGGSHSHSTNNNADVPVFYTELAFIVRVI